MGHNLRCLGATVLILMALSMLCAALSAQSFSHIVSFQGRLADSATGKPLADGQYSVTFRIYDAASAGTKLWEETQTVDQEGGVFTVYLAKVTAFPSDLFTDGDRWLSLQVGADPEMTDRYQFTPSPWAIYSGTSGTDNDWAFSGSDIYRATGKVGIGRSTPSAKLEVYGAGEMIRHMADPDWDRRIDMLYHPSIGPLLRGAGYPRLTIDANSVEGEGMIVLGHGGDKVGIGTIDPGYPLHVEGDTRIVGDLQVGDILDLHGTLRLGLGHYYPTQICDTTGIERITILTDGKVGVWTTGPRNEFDVKGDVAIGDDAFRTAISGNGLIVQGRIGAGTNNPQRAVHINDVLRLEPRSGPPSSPAEGDIYVDEGLGGIFCYIGGQWQQLN